MSNFWATKLGVQPPAPPAPAPVQPAVQPWYAPPQYQQQVPPPQPQYATPGYPQQVPQGQPYPGHPQAPQQQPEQQGWGTVEGSLRRAQSAKSDDRCPECGSGNYFHRGGTSKGLLQCSACGYNDRFTQSGGMGGLPSSEGGPATPARQTVSGGAGGSQFQPKTIVGRVG